jgi:hypothetical protein
MAQLKVDAQPDTICATIFFDLSCIVFHIESSQRVALQSDGANYQSVGMLTARSYSAGCRKLPRLKTDAGATCHGVGIDPTRGSL